MRSPLLWGLLLPLIHSSSTLTRDQTAGSGCLRYRPPLPHHPLSNAWYIYLSPDPSSRGSIGQASVRRDFFLNCLGKMMAVTESELAGSFSRIGEDASDKDFIVKCEHMVKREREREGHVVRPNTRLQGRWCICMLSVSAFCVGVFKIVKFARFSTWLLLLLLFRAIVALVCLYALRTQAASSTHHISYIPRSSRVVPVGIATRFGCRSRSIHPSRPFLLQLSRRKSSCIRGTCTSLCP